MLSMKTIHQLDLYDLQLMKIRTEILTDQTTEDTISFLSKWNQIGPLHAEFIKELACCYAEQLFGEK